MMDFYEGEALRREVLIRNAIKRTTKRTAISDAELFYGTPSEHIHVEQDDSRHSSPVRVEVTDYDYDYGYDGSSDEDYDSQDDDQLDNDLNEQPPLHAHTTVKDEHTWFDDLLDEVSVDAAVADTPTVHVRAVRLRDPAAKARQHPADRPENLDPSLLLCGESSASSSVESLSDSRLSERASTSIPSLVDDDDSSGEDENEEEDECQGYGDMDEEQRPDRSTKHSSKSADQHRPDPIAYLGGAPLSSGHDARHRLAAQRFSAPVRLSLAPVRPSALVAW